MNYISQLIHLILFILVVFFIVLVIRKNIIINIYIKIIESKFTISLKIRLFINLINITVPIYPRKNKQRRGKKIKDKKEKQSRLDARKVVSLDNIEKMYNTLNKIELDEIYSNIEIANSNIQITALYNVLINMIYGTIISAIDTNDIYLKVIPNFQKEYTNGIIKIKIKTSIKDILEIIIMFLKIYFTSKKKDKGDNNESYKFYTKPYGNNS